MKPVTSTDVARFVAGRVTDEDELDRITHAISKQSELEDLFFMLSHDEEFETSAVDIDAEIVDAARTRLELLSRARLCRLHGDLPDAGGNSLSKATLQSHLPNLQTDCEINAIGDGRYRLKVNLPTDHIVLNLVAANLNWRATDDFTRVRVHRDWNPPKVTLADTNSNASATAFAEMPTSLAADSLDSRKGSGDEVLTEHNGETFILTIASESPRSANVICLNESVSYPLPVMFTGVASTGEWIQDARLLRSDAEQFTDLFAKTDADVRVLEVCPLPLNELSRLCPSDATELLATQKFAVRAAESLPDKPGEYELNLSQESTANLLECPNVTLCLSIAATDAEVQR